MKQPRASSRILVIEDDSLVSGVLCAVLRRVGHDVVLAQSSHEAVEMARNSHRGFDLTIADVLLGHDTSRTAVAELRRLRPDTPVLFMSGLPLHLLTHMGHMADQVIDDRSGFFLQKPFMPAELVAVVEFALEAGRHGKDLARATA
jgi:DNA-binding response OmpR family regulator